MAWLRALNARTPLRLRLVATLLLLVAAALVVSGVVATATLRGYLVDRVDTQLQDVAHQVGEHGLGSTGPGGRETGGDFDPRFPSAYVMQVSDAAGKVVFGPTGNLIGNQPLPRLPTVTRSDDSSSASHLRTVGAVSGSGQWRLLTVPVLLTSGSSGTLFIAQSLGDVQSTVHRLSLLLLVIGGIAVVLIAGVGYVVVRASLRPLREVERTAASIAAGDLSQRVPPADARTEVGQLSGALNGMLGQIETAFARQAESEEAARRSEERMRRFVADASHELRTPLTSIRGFAELYRQGAATAPSDVPRLMRRIEDEAKRMGVLVDDLLLLARLDQQRPLEQAPVDMLALAQDAVHDARVLDADRDIALEVGSTEPPPVVVGDDARLRQVLGNLMANAMQHTPPRTPITVSVRTFVDESSGTGVVLLEVADQGPGMPREQAARVFERFYRADASRTRSAGGTGLGLAIVAALVAGHDGRVGVETAPGAGARFRVELPLARTAVDVTPG